MRSSGLSGSVLRRSRTWAPIENSIAPTESCSEACIRCRSAATAVSRPAAARVGQPQRPGGVAATALHRAHRVVAELARAAQRGVGHRDHGGTLPGPAVGCRIGTASMADIASRLTTPSNWWVMLRAVT